MSTDRVWRRFYAQEDKLKDRPKMPLWLLDKIADEKANGMWDMRPENLCGECHTYRSRNGKCLCSE